MQRPGSSLITLLVFTAVACGHRNPQPDGGLCPAGAIQSQAIDLPGCDGLGPGTEDCHARMFWDPGQCCAAKPCSRLVVYWSGGEQSCDNGTLDSLLKHYAGAGFVAACAQPYTTSDEGGAYPYHVEFDRMNHVLESVRGESASRWDGKNLLIAGVSHGGTAPLVMIASRRALKEHAAAWTGSERTAVVLFDGISNPKTLEEWAGAQPGGSGCDQMHQRWVGRYRDGSPLTHSCSNGACYCGAPAHADDWIKDTVVIGASEPPSTYACADFTPAAGNVLYRFVSCGGGSAAACGLLGDIIPDEQQTAAFEALRGCAGVTASYADYPGCAHVLCGGWDSCGGADAVGWLEQNGW